MSDSFVHKRSRLLHGVTPAALATVLLPLLLVALSACGLFEQTSRLEIGLVETGGVNRTRASFTTLTGRKTKGEALDRGDTLELHYEIEVEEGTLALLVKDPDERVIWERQWEQGAGVREAVELAAESSGTYTIIVEGDGANGSYDLSWDEIE